MEKLGKAQEPKEQEQENPWYDYNIENNEKINEIIVTLRLTKKQYRTAYTLAHLLDHKSLDD